MFFHNSKSFKYWQKYMTHRWCIPQHSSKFITVLRGDPLVGHNFSSNSMSTVLNIGRKYMTHWWCIPQHSSKFITVLRGDPLVGHDFSSNAMSTVLN